MRATVQKNQRVELEMKIMKYRLLARRATAVMKSCRIEDLISELQQELREIDG